ncbi:FmdB family zinc ribbon protein [Melioribacteraceae bacterium 4301-Me]|uniref:FmdB family zinc ribbon protein n=1 Tax=Pyranulibacter aquaticus TaxID=3163344 RepID=UPI003598F364
MPTYDYKCTSCGYTFEVFQKISDEPIGFCPKCNGKVKRLIGAGAGTIFKGSGFYQTDYKNKSNKPTEVKKTEGDKHSGDKDRK